MRVVPEDRALGRILTFEFGHEAGAVKVLLRKRRQPGHGEDGGEKIRGGHRLGANTTRAGGAGPLDQERFAHATFVGPAFARTQRQVGSRRTLGGGEPAIVRREYDDGIFVEFQFCEFVEDAADIVIEVFDHRGVGGVVLHLPHGAAVVVEELGASPGGKLGRFGFVFFQQGGFGLQRVVDGVVREVNEERLFAILLDEADRLAGETVGEVFPLRSIRQVREFIRAEIGWWRALSATAQVEVEALMLGPMLGRFAEMPFSEESGFVAAGLQSLGEGDFIERQEWLNRRPLELLVRFVLAARQPVRDAQARGVFAGQDARARRRANRRGGVGIGKAHAFLRQAVKIGRFVKSASVATDVRPAEIIGEDENNVRLPRRGSGVQQSGCGEQARGSEKAAFQKREKREGRFHWTGSSVRLLRSMSSLPVMSPASTLMSNSPGLSTRRPRSRATFIPCCRTSPFNV